MRKFLIYLCLGLLATSLLVSQGLSGENEKIAQSGFQFLSVSSDARATALGNAVNSLELASSSLFYNPAGMAAMTEMIDISFSINNWIADINHNTFTMAISPADGRYGVFGVSYQGVDYGDVLGTIVSNNSIGYEDTGVFSPSASAFGFGYARALNDRFSVGGQIKWVRQDLGDAVIGESDTTTSNDENVMKPLSYDFGTIYKTGFKSLVFGMSVRNFSKEIKYEEEGFQLPLVFTLGISMDLMDFASFKAPNHSIIFSIDATHYRSHSEQVLFGIDYQFMKLVSLRGGYIVGNDEDNLAFGFGISQFGAVFDYAYTPLNSFDNVQRITARFAF